MNLCANKCKSSKSQYFKGFPHGSAVENPPANEGDAVLLPGSGRSPGEGNDNPLQYSCLGNPMDRGEPLLTLHLNQPTRIGFLHYGLQLSSFPFCELIAPLEFCG